MSRWAAILGICAIVWGGGLRAAWANEVNVAFWTDYIPAEVLERFARETGIKVNLRNFESDLVLDEVLRKGRSGLDVVVPTFSPYFANQLKAGLFRPLDKAKLPNLKHLDPQTMRAVALVDSGNAYGVPYLKTTTVVGYNADKVRAILGNQPLDTWKMVFDPDWVQKLRTCGVGVIDAAEEVIPAALAYLGKRGSSQSSSDLAQAAEAIAKARPYFKYIRTSRYISDLANGDVCVVLGYAGDIIQAKRRARQAGRGVRVGVALPREGFAFSLDMMAIPKDSPHPDNAHKFIDFVQRPEIIAEITNYTGFANSNLAAEALIKDEIKFDPAVYLPPEVKPIVFSVMPADREYEAARAKAWDELKKKKPQ